MEVTTKQSFKMTWPSLYLKLAVSELMKILPPKGGQSIPTAYLHFKYAKKKKSVLKSKFHMYIMSLTSSITATEAQYLCGMIVKHGIFITAQH